MLDIKQPKFQWGQLVRAVEDLANDGSHPECRADELLVGRGATGEVVQTGLHQETNTHVYIVEFEGGMVVGCLEAELEAA